MTLRRPRRVDGFAYRGPYRYLLTFCTANRQPIFVAPQAANLVTQCVRQTAGEESFLLIAHCVMPDHVHLLVEGQSDAAELKRFMKIAKQRITYSLREKQGMKCALQEGYHDWVLRREESTEDFIRYILANPVRAGIVEDPEDYPFSGCIFPLT